MAAPQTEVLITVDGSERGRYLFRPGDYIIGREEGCHIRVEAELVSRRHAKLVLNYDHAIIEDLGSSNGTRVNGTPVSAATRLWPNQKIQVGAATIELRRLKVEVSDQSLMPAQAVVRNVLPEEFLREKKYDIGKVIAQGGMGAILDAKEATIERTVAMKVMLDTNDPDALARFLNEAKITGQLEHPNIVPVHELSVDENGQPFYTMKMVRGITLKKVLAHIAEGTEATVRKYPLPALLTIFQKVCDALAFAHSRGIIHRDLKPENIMLDDFGVVLVMDWGLAKRIKQDGSRMPEGSAASEEDIHTIRHTVAAEMAVSATFDPATMASTLAGTVMGTPQFMSPEQARGEVATLDARSDIYSLGAILFQILTLRLPVTGKDAWDIIGKVSRGEVEPLECGSPLPLSPERSDAAGDGDSPGHGTPATASPPAAKRQRAGAVQKARPIPESLAAVVHKAMALDKAVRYATVAELQRDLEAYQTGFATSAENAGAWKQFTLFARRNKAASLGVAAVLLTGSVLGTKAIIEGNRAKREAARAERGEAKANGALSDLKKTAPALFRLARTEAEGQRYDRAAEALEAGLALEPADKPALWQRAWVLLAQKRYAEAALAAHAALERDPKAARATSLLPVLDQLATASTDSERFTTTRIDTLRRDLPQMEAGHVIVALSEKLRFANNEKFTLVRDRLDAAYGKGNVYVTKQPDGSILVDLTANPQNSTVEPLRGLPFNHLLLGANFRGTLVSDLSPLRGLQLQTLRMAGHKTISDLRPLAGMPLVELSCWGCSSVADISALKGAPLRKLHLNETKIKSCEDLQGMPLEELNISNTLVVDLKPLATSAIQILNISNTVVRDLRPLTGMPLKVLHMEDTSVDDISPLRGIPLEILSIRKTRVRDLSPLRGLPIVTLRIPDIPKETDVAPLLELDKLQQLAVSPGQKNLPLLRKHPTIRQIDLVAPFSKFRDVAEFWKEYDAKQAAGKK